MQRIQDVAVVTELVAAYQNRTVEFRCGNSEIYLSNLIATNRGREMTYNQVLDSVVFTSRAIENRA